MLRLLNKYYTIRNLLFFLIEFVLIFFGLWLGTYLLYQGQIIEDQLHANLWYRILLVTVIIQLCMYYNDLYDFQKDSGLLGLTLRIIQAIGFSCLIIGFLYFIFPVLILKQGTFFIGLFILLIFLVLWRKIYLTLCKKAIFNNKIFIIGDGHLARLIAEKINSDLDSGYTIAGFFSVNENSPLADDTGVAHYREPDKICALARKKGVDQIVVALEEKRKQFPVKSLLDARTQGIEVIDGVSFYERLSGRILVNQAQPSWLIFSEGFKRNIIINWSKRFIDIIFAGIGLILTAPIMGIIALAIKLDSRGPVFFKQDRVGQKEKSYQVIKFRTMCEDAEQDGQAQWAQSDDKRITRVGHILRKFRLDELPQFWNVIKGNMSFVGPRPERQVFVDQLKERLPYYGERHTVKPGITGWAQINYGYGASEEDALRKLEYELFYIKNHSILFDIYIVLKTVKTVLVGEGAR